MIQQCPTTPRPPVQRSLWLALAVIVLLLAAGLRLHQLDAQSLWNDEGASYAMTQRTPEAIIANAAADIHPPGYYLLLAGWTRLAGTSEFALRFPSALTSLLTVALIYTLGRRLSGRGAGIAAALLLAANTFAIYYAQEARMYALLGLWASAGMAALVAWLERDGTSHVPLIALALINTAGLYTQYAYPLTMLAQGALFVLWWVWRSPRWQPLLRYVAANLLTLAFFTPWIGEALRQVTTWPNSGAGTPPETLLSTVAFGLAAGSPPWWAIFAALTCAATGLWFRRDRPLLALPAIWAAVTLGAFALLRLQPDDIKQLTPAASAIALWLGAGLAALWRERCAAPRIAAVAVTVALGATLLGALPALYSDPAFQRDDYRAMAAAVRAEAGSDDAVILTGPGQGEVWAYYYDGPLPVYPLPRGLGGDDAATRAELETILRNHRRIFALFWGEQERDPNGIVTGTLASQAFEVRSVWVGRVRFVVYAVPHEAAHAPTTLLDLRFAAANGDALVLEGYALDRVESYAPGNALTLTLFWRADSLLQTRYKVFVHLYANPDAPPPAQHDSEPGGGLAPTTTWTPGATVIDRHGILIPADLPPGEYTLAVGVYAADDPAARLTSPQGERVAIRQVHVG
ncbi:MAG: hypothetical protein HPY64_11385 [Anaerolineae bacterium]|nr:hypothetical protein [Anaerolineae bacterium]